MRSVNEDRLQKTLEYILEYQKRESKAPTYRQIQKECGYNSLGTVAADVARLKKRHLIESSDEGGWNSIKLPSRLSVEDKHKPFFSISCVWVLKIVLRFSNETFLTFLDSN